MLGKAKIENIVKKHIEGTDKFLVEVEVSKTNVVNVFVDGDKGISIEECVKLSRVIESNFDRDLEDYELRVSSPGLDKPFKLHRQYEKYIGREIQVLTNSGEKFKGILKSVSKERLQIEKGKEKKGKGLVDTSLMFSNIKEVKPVITFKKNN